ncbi:CU044_2847 family protein [Streptomyces sp. GMY02]|uniref:CU044_2847 family protein n=1 Tax=Streptomyces sp. GMY02 TaxID=1333528 RepID=UPI0020B73CBC|nr:CU044_2847 family protein [Streptomyces sp. GMY02]
MGDVRLTFDDGSVVRLQLAPAGPANGTRNTESRVRAGGVPDAADGLELPDGFGTAQPVSVGSRTTQAVTRSGEVLAEALRPLSGVLGGIHRSLSESVHRPDEVTVEFGVTLGSDLSLGVFSGSGEASFTVSATWNLAAAPPVPAPAPGPDPAATGTPTSDAPTHGPAAGRAATNGSTAPSAAS